MKNLEEMKIYHDELIQEINELDRELTENDRLTLLMLTYTREILEEIKCEH